MSKRRKGDKGMRIGIATEGRDYGTPELRQHKRVDYVALESERLPVAKVSNECLLDRLYHRGKLAYRHEPGPPHDDEARRRLMAGLWLRSLYQRAGIGQRVTMAYSVFGHTDGGGGAEMSDAEAWNLRAWVETMRDLSRYAYVLRQVCGMDETPRTRTADLREALDALADLRGM